MRYLTTPSPHGKYVSATGEKCDLREIAEAAKVNGPRKPIVADSEADAAKQAGLTFSPVAPKPAPPKPKPKPVAVPLWKFRAACRMAGIFDAITDAIGLLPEPQKTVVGEGWEYGNDIDPASATVQSLATALKLTEEQLGDVFRSAAAITV